MDFYALSRRELQALCKRNNVRANMTNAAMAETLDSLDLLYGINYEIPAPTVTTRLAARKSVSKPVRVILRRSPRTVTLKASVLEPKGEDDSTEAAASKMPHATLMYETSEDDGLDEDEEWALNDDDSTEEDEVPCETHEENDTVFTSGIPQSSDNEMYTGPDQAALELLKDLQGISLNMLRATYKEFTDKQTICSSVSSSCTA